MRFVLQWHITERCNLRCTHCYQETEQSAELPLSTLLAILDQFKALLRDLEIRRGVPQSGIINVTGGEPFVHADCMALLEALAASGPQIEFGILTNGTLIDDALATRLRRLRPRTVQVSIDGSEATHDRIRGRGSFRRAVAAVRALVRAGIRASISFTAHRQNYREFPEVARLARRLRADRVWSDRLIPMGRGCELETLSPEESRQLFRLMRDARKEADAHWFRRTNVSFVRALQFLEGGHPYQCKAGATLLTLLPNGDLCPCRRMPIPVGNVNDVPMPRLYFESETLVTLRDSERVSAGCRSCRFERHCRGGLRCLAYAITGSPFNADPGCWLADPDAQRATPWPA